MEPNDRYLYDLEVPPVKRSGQVVDEVSSYAGLRTIRTVSDAQGRPRIALNGDITFLHGPLDEGYWPDGIYPAPTDAALNFDLEQMKALGNEFRPQAREGGTSAVVLLNRQARAVGVAGHAVNERVTQTPRGWWSRTVARAAANRAATPVRANLRRPTPTSDRAIRW